MTRLAPDSWSVALRSKEALHYHLLEYYDRVNEHLITPTLENFESAFKVFFNRILFIKEGDKIQVSHFGYVGAVIDTTKNEISIYELNKEPSVLVTIKLQPNKKGNNQCLNRSLKNPL